MIVRTAVLIIGCLLIACGVHFFLVPFHILDGGVIGLSLIVNYMWGVRIGAAWLLFSIPIFIAAWRYHRTLFFGGIHGLWISAVFMELVAPFQYYFLYYIELTPLSSALLGGVVIGDGFGILLRYNMSTGGTDLLANLLAMRSLFNVGFVVTAFDIAIISLGGLLFNTETLWLSAITVTTGGLVTTLLTFHRRIKVNDS